jgi:hypothetical protein
MTPELMESWLVCGIDMVVSVTGQCHPNRLEGKYAGLSLTES